MPVSIPVPIPLLEGLPTEDLSRLNGLFTRRSYDAGTDVVRQGERCNSLFVIEAGSLVVRSAERGHLARLGPGECVGEISLFTGEAASATVTAVTDAVLRVASQAEIRRLADEYPVLARNFCRLLGRRLSHLGQRAEKHGITVLIPLQGSVGIGFAMNLAASLAHHVQKDVALVDAFSPAPRYGGPDVAPTFKQPPRWITVVRSAGLPPDQLAPLADALAHRCEHVLIWAPENAVEQLAPLIAAADRILLAVPHAGCRTTDYAAWRLPEPATELVVVNSPEPRSVAVREAVEQDTGLPVAALLPAVPRNLDETGAALDWARRQRDTPYARETDRLARRLTGKSVGLALGAGSGRGHAHLGVLRALDKLDIRPDFIAGTSVGACVAAYSLLGVPYQEIGYALQRLGQFIRQWSVPLYSLRTGAGLERALRSAIPDELQIEDFDTPFAILTADLLSGEEVAIRRGSVWRCLRASASIPGVFPPVWLDGRLLVDGGVVSPVPCPTLRAMGADVILGVSLETTPGVGAPNLREGKDGEGPRRQTWPQVLLRALDVQQMALARQGVTAADVPLHVYTAPTNLTDFRGGPELLEAGEQAVEEARHRLNELLPWTNR